MALNPEIRDKIKAEIKNDLAISDADIDKESFNWGEILQYDKLSELQYMSMVINESLRLSPPVSLSTLATLTETTELGGFKVDKG